MAGMRVARRVPSSILRPTMAVLSPPSSGSRKKKRAEASRDGSG
jgi:hypothetical protein